MKSELIPLAEELLVETVRHYNSSNRSEDGSCQYLMADGRRCAAGRMMTDEGVVKASKSNNDSVYMLRGELGKEVFLSIFQERWRPLLADEGGMALVRSVQGLHDIGRNWTPNGLSADNGAAQVRRICQTHGLSPEVMERIKRS